MVLVVLIVAGCVNPTGTTVPAINSSGTVGNINGPGNCKSCEECTVYCSANHNACDQYCREHAEICNRLGSPGQKPLSGELGSGEFGAGTACDTPVIKKKMMTEINKILVSPPDYLRPPNWMTKILPASNPYPGYYYDISTAFVPAIDAQTSAWSGVGEPPRTAGLDYYTVGYWEEIPKGVSGQMGEKTTDLIDLSQYQLAVFYTNVTGKCTRQCGTTRTTRRTTGTSRSASVISR